MKYNYFGLNFFGALNKKIIKFKFYDKLENLNNILIYIYDKNRNLKKIITKFYENYNEFSINQIKFEINKTGCGQCIVEFSDAKFVNFSIEAEDIFEIYIDNKKLYVGFVLNDFDYTSKQVVLNGFVKQLDEFCFNGIFTNKTIKQILSSIFSYLNNKIKIKYSDSLIFDSGEVFTFEFKNEKIVDIVKKLTNLQNNCYFFVDNNNYLNIKKINKQNIQKYYPVFTEKIFFEDLDIKFDYSNIDATEYKVYKNNTDGVEIFVGNVGNEGNTQFPPLPIVNKIRKMEGIYTASEVVSDNLALRIAYEDLKNKAKIKQSLKVKNINLKEYLPSIDDYLEFEFFEYFKNFNNYKVNRIVDNVTKINYLIYENGVKCDLSLGDLIEEEGEELYNLKKKIRILETINKI